MPTSGKVSDKYTPPAESVPAPSPSPTRQPNLTGEDDDDVGTAVDPDQEAAAIRIQAVSRQRAAKKRVEEVREEKQQELEEQTEAATLIQAQARRRAAKKRVEDLKTAQNNPTAVDPDQEAAAIRIQAVSRQRAAKKRVEEVREEKQKELKDQTEAATLIQAQARRRADAKRVEELRAGKAASAAPAPAPAPAAASASAAPTTPIDPEQEAAAVRIQAVSRQRAAKKRVEEVREEKRQQEVEEQTGAATLIQSQARRRAAKKRVEELKAVQNGATSTSTPAPAPAADADTDAGATSTEPTNEDIAEQEKAATLIQSQARRRAAAKRVEDIKATTTTTTTAAPSALDPSVGQAVLFYCGRKLPDVGYVMVSVSDAGDNYKLSTYDPNTSTGLNALYPKADVEAVAAAHDPALPSSPVDMASFICRQGMTVSGGAIQLTSAPPTAAPAGAAAGAGAGTSGDSAAAAVSHFQKTRSIRDAVVLVRVELVDGKYSVTTYESTTGVALEAEFSKDAVTAATTSSPSLEAVADAIDIVDGAVVIG